MTPLSWLLFALVLVIAWLISGRTFARGPFFVLAAMILLALLAPLVSGYAPNAQLDVVALQNQPPSLLHPLGTDLYSRDVWSRLVYGARISLLVGALGMVVAVGLGSVVGAAAGYWSGPVDAALMRFTDVGLAIPRIFVLLVLAAVWERLSLPVLILVIGLTSWFATSRLVRAEVMSLAGRPFIVAAQAQGVGSLRIVWRHVLPNAAAPILVSAALGTGGVILLESALSFLGYGVPAPLASWGSMIADSRDHVRQAPWAALAPGLAIAIVVMACSGLADALRGSLGGPRENPEP